MKKLEIVLKDVEYVYSPKTHYEKRIKLDGELKVKSGEVVLITGKNGSGKTTLLQIAAVLLKPTSGLITIDGENPWKDPRNYRRKIGFSFQFPEDQFFEMNVFDEVVFAPKNYGLDNLEERYVKSMEIVGLDPDEYRDKVPFFLSGGEKRKVAIASIISHDPDVLILDEPLVGLDIPSREDMLKILSKWKNQGKSMLISTHRVKAFSSISDVVIDIGQ